MIASSLVLGLLGLASTVTPSPLDKVARFKSLRPRQSLTDIQSSITNIGTSLAAANNSVVAFQSGGLDGITGLVDVNEKTVALGNNLTAGITTAQSTAQLSATDSTTVGIQFLMLQPNINQLLNNLVGKKTDFDNAAFGILDTRSLIHDVLAEQQNNSAELGSSLINVLDPTLRGIAEPINNQIQGNFTAAVSSFDGRSGVIKIPTSLVPTASELLAKLGPALEKILGGLSSRAEGHKYCCGITQDMLDQLGPDENDTEKLPKLVVGALKAVGII